MSVIVYSLAINHLLLFVYLFSDTVVEATFMHDHVPPVQHFSTSCKTAERAIMETEKRAIM
jgi:hypothetical protein